MYKPVQKVLFLVRSTLESINWCKSNWFHHIKWDNWKHQSGKYQRLSISSSKYRRRWRIKQLSTKSAVAHLHFNKCLRTQEGKKFAQPFTMQMTNKWKCLSHSWLNGFPRIACCLTLNCHYYLIVTKIISLFAYKNNCYCKGWRWSILFSFQTKSTPIIEEMKDIFIAPKWKISKIMRYYETGY